MATIEVRARYAGSILGEIPYYHSFIVVTYDDGSEFYLRAGSTDGEAGYVLGVYGAYVPGTPDFDEEGDDLSVVVYSGSDAEVAQLYDTMVAATNAINEANYPYDAFVQGCNAFSSEMLETIGVDYQLPLDADGHTPWCPAFYEGLKYPDGEPRFDAMLRSYENWLVTNGFDHSVSQILFFAEAVLATFPDADFVSESTAVLEQWLVGKLGPAATVGTNDADSLSGGGSAEILSGLAGADVLLGAGGNDILYAGSGNDTVDGGAGADTMFGNGGNDNFVVNDAADQVVEHAGEGGDTVYASVSFVLDDNVERLALTGNAGIDGVGNALSNHLAGNDAANTLEGGAAADRLIGNGGADALYGDDGGDALLGGAGDDTLHGGAGSDRLDGGAGADRMAGGAHDDLYLVDSSSDQVIEAASEGRDQVISSASFALGAGVEGLILTGNAAVDGRGNALANSLAGNDAANTLEGGGASDALMGNGGADVFVFDDGDGTDMIIDFRAGMDVCDLTGVAGVDEFSDLRLVDTGAAVYVSYGTGGFALAGVADIEDVDASDFIFA